MSKLTKNMDIVLQQGPDLIEFYRNNPCIAAYELLGVDLAPVQRIVFEAMWFKPYTLSVATRGFGKCVYVGEIAAFLNTGMVYLHELLPKIPEYLKDGTEEVIDGVSAIYTDRGFRYTKKLALEKGIIGKKIVTQNGIVKRGSSHHPILTIDYEGNFVYKTLAEFSVGDKVCIQRGQNTFGITSLTSDTAYLIGLLIGDGSLAKVGVTLTSEDPEILNFCYQYCESNNIYYSSKYDKRTKATYKVRFSNTINEILKRYKVDKVLSYYKTVPYSIRTSTRESQIAFLQGYFDTDGTGHTTNGGVSCCSVSRQLLEEIQMMLLNLGIIARLREKKTKSDFGKAYLLDMFSEDAYKFKELIGFRLKRKQTILNNYFSSKALNPNKDTVPYVLNVCKAITTYYQTTYRTSKKPSFNIETTNKKELTYVKLHEFLEQCISIEDKGFSLEQVSHFITNLKDILKYNYYFDTVVSIEDWKGDCYDFEMDMESGVEPNYMTNGFINHNTFLSGTLSALLALLYPGYRVGLIGPSFRQSLVVSSRNHDTFWTSEGMITGAENLYNLVDSTTELYTQSLYGQNRVLSNWLNPDRDCIGIETTKGFSIKGTADHGIVKLNTETSKIDFIDLCDICEGDVVLIRKGFNYFGDNNVLPTYSFKHDWRTKDCNIPVDLTEDLSYLFGLLVGDGRISIDSAGRKYRVMFTSGDEELLSAFEFLMLKYFDVVPTDRNQKNRAPQISYYCKKLVNFLLQCGFTKTTALDKKIPYIIKRSSKKCFTAFIQGLMDTDGSCYIQTHNNNSTHCEISLSTSSIQLAKEVQSFLLNIGIVSNFGTSVKPGLRKLIGRDIYSICSTGYKVRVTGRPNLELAYNLFRLERKSSSIKCYLDQHFNNREISLAMCVGLPKKIVDLHPAIYSQYLRDGFYFVRVIGKEHFFAPTMDIEVEDESCYFSSGFISHNSKMIFAEIEKLYASSPILSAATEKRPIRGSDTCYLKFRAVSGHNGAFIEALPLGADGGKIRGSRFYCVIVDEFAQVPSKIIETVLAPMSITKLDPMKKVRELERRTALIEAGLACDDDFAEDSINKMIGTSSGYYKFNHMYKRMREYWDQIEEGSKDHAVFQIPYTALPDGFLDPKNIENAERVMSSHEFAMEYLGAMVSDSEGFFKASILEKCSTMEYTIELSGDKGSSYIIGIDPNQGGKAKCGVVIIKLGKPNKVVRVLALDGKTTQDITMSLQELCNSYNVLRIFMDRGGGGKSVADLLAEGYNGAEPILNRNDKGTLTLKGNRILELITFSTSWIADANFAALSLFEDGHLQFPIVPVDVVSDLILDEYDLINELKKQCLNIVVTQTSGGSLHFDTPKKGQNKDIYSALILASYGVKVLEHEIVDETSKTSMHSSGGLVRNRNTSNWSAATGINSVSSSLSMAVLTRKK